MHRVGFILSMNQILKVPERYVNHIVEIGQCLHNISLIVDDICDDTELRRGALRCITSDNKLATFVTVVVEGNSEIPLCCTFPEWASSAQPCRACVFPLEGGLFFLVWRSLGLPTAHMEYGVSAALLSAYTGLFQILLSVDVHLNNTWVALEECARMHHCNAMEVCVPSLPILLKRAS